MKNIDNIKVERGYAILTKDRTKGIKVTNTAGGWSYTLTSDIEKVTVCKPEFSARNVMQLYINNHKKTTDLEVVPVKVTTKYQVTLEEVTTDTQQIGGDNN